MPKATHYFEKDGASVDIDLHDEDSVKNVWEKLASATNLTPKQTIKIYHSNGCLIPIGSKIPKNHEHSRYKLVVMEGSTIDSQEEKTRKNLSVIQKKMEQLKRFSHSKVKDENIVLKPAISKVNELMDNLKPLNISSIKKIPMFPESTYESLKTPQLDIWVFSENELIHLIAQKFHRLGLVKHFKINEDTLFRFLVVISKAYNANPFHNFKHCFCVTQMMYCLLHLDNLHERLTMVEKLALIVGSIGHDIDHPGLNNAYQMNALTMLSVTYNDSSPLENHHCASLFSILRQPECNILENLSPTDYKDTRKIIIGCILATDMGKHAECIGKLREIGPNFNIDEPAHRTLLLQTLLKCADISNEARPKEVAEKWVDCLLEEFFAQSDREKEEKLPTAPFMDRNKVTKPSAQGFVLLPLFEDTSKLLPGLKPLICNIQQSKQFYLNYIG
ncbi:High affinity cAMP-specific and IBMX-insensitive 3',5'-cyclic phosphodiesterase 9A [Globomyces sp. JEL0801]|nr:High affinity cAMP-specific and IBMX-insensitive 3',5'-cyclic phosphodiesterase 9A [Globomyces sp. JEL0801]